MPVKILGQRALASRAKIMLGIGWEIGDDIQSSWVECVETVMAGCPGSNVLSVAISIGASREMLQRSEEHTSELQLPTKRLTLDSRP